MTFRTRLLVAFGVVVLVPLLVFGLGIRREMSRRVTGEYDRRVGSLVAVIRADLARETDRIGSRLARLKNALSADNRFRAGVVRGEDRGYLLDYAGDAMQLAGLDFLQIQDDEGRVLSSGHFRNEFDRFGPRVTGTTLVRAGTAEGPFLALALADSLHLGGRSLRLVGGVTVDSAFRARLARDPEFGVAVAFPTDTAPLDPNVQVVGEVALPFVDASEGPGRIDRARIVV